MFFPDIKIGGASYPAVPSVKLPDAFMEGVYNQYAFIDDSAPLSITENGTHDVTNYASVNVNVQGGGGGGLPAGIKALDYGTYTLDADISGSSSATTNIMQINHKLGEKPDMILFWAPENVAQTYTMLGMLWGVPWRSADYPTNVWYHSTSTTTISGTTASSTYGIRNVTSTSFSVKTHNNSTSYFWRAGTYKWIAIKFS